MKSLFNHTSPETAFLCEDYPYGFRLRCKIRYWIEFKKNKGYRFCSQTTNPRTGDVAWNKPKYSTYHEYAVLTQDESNNHIHYDCVSPYDTSAQLEEFKNKHNITDSNFDTVIMAKKKIEKWWEEKKTKEQV